MSLSPTIILSPQEMYDSEVEKALAKYSEVTGDPATTDVMSSEDIEVCRALPGACQRMCA